MAAYQEPGEEKLSDRPGTAGASSGRNTREQEADFDTETPVVLGKIEAQLRHNLKALRHLNEDLDDPYVQGTVQRLIRELHGQQREVATLRQLTARYPELGSLSRVRQRLNFWFQSSNTRSFLWGAGLSLLALMVLPAARKGFRPLVVMLVREMMELTQKSQELVAGLREGLEDLVSEAQFEALKHSLEPETQELPVPAPGPEK